MPRRECSRRAELTAGRELAMLAAAMARTHPDEIRGYSRLIHQAIASIPTFVPETESDTSIQIERGTIFPICLCASGPTDFHPWVDRLIAHPQDLDRITVVDRAGHGRPAYAGLLFYSWAQTYRVCREASLKIPVESWLEPLRAWCRMLETPLMGFTWPLGGVAARRGSETVRAACAAMALYAAGGVLGEGRWTALGGDFLGHLSANQQATGAFLRSGPADNPETLWYHELTLLHAVASYAALANDPLATAAVMQAADFHLGQTQPDHATTEPWGLLAFIWRRQAHELADAMLHALAVQHPRGIDGVTSMLLADCLYCLGRL